MSSIGSILLTIGYVMVIATAPYLGINPSPWWLLGFVPIIPLGWVFDDLVGWSKVGDL